MDLKYFDLNFSVFIVIGACLFAYTNHFGVIPIMKMLNQESDHTNYSALWRSHYFPIFLYGTVAFMGYMSFGQDTPDFIL